MAREPSDAYNPTPSVNPSTDMPGDYVGVRATPNAFGANVGEALGQLGSAAEKVGQGAVQVAIQRQGQINESLASNADLKLQQMQADVSADYLSRKGLDAVQARTSASQDIINAQAAVRETLPNDAAKRMFDLQATRRTGYALSNFASHAGTQEKQFNVDSANSMLKSHVEDFANPSIAFDDYRSGVALGNVKADVARLMELDGYDPKDPQTQVILKQRTDMALDAAWTAKLNTEAYDPQHGNINQAVADLEKHKDLIPAATYAKLSKELSVPYKNLQLSTTVDGWIKQDLGDYADHTAAVGAGGSKTGPGATAPEPSGFGTNSPQAFRDNAQGALSDITNADPQSIHITSDIRGVRQNKLAGGVDDSAHLSGDAWDTHQDGVAGPAYATQIVNGLANKKIPFDQVIIEGDTVHVGFGNGNRGQVLERHGTIGHYTYTPIEIPGVPPPVTATMPGGPPTTTGSLSPGAFLQKNFDDNYNKHRAELESDPYFSQHPELVDTAMDRWRTQTGVRISAEHEAVYGDKQTVANYLETQAANGHPVTDVSQLYGVPGVGDSMKNIDANDSFAGTSIATRLIPSFARGMAPTWGTSFSDVYGKVVSGEIRSPDQLANYMVGTDKNNMPLTNSGFVTLNNLMKQMADPNFHNQQTQIWNWLQSPTVRGAITGTGTIPGMHDGVGDRNYNKFLQSVMPLITAKLGSGVPLDAMLDPKNKDYIGGMISQFTRHTSAQMADQGKPGTSMPNVPPKPFDPGSIKSYDDLRKAAKEGHLTKQQYVDIGTKNGWGSAPAPSVPVRQ